MKLHLPSRLRKALLACLAAVALPAATIPTTLASASGIAAVFLIASQRANAEFTGGTISGNGTTDVGAKSGGVTCEGITLNDGEEHTLNLTTGDDGRLTVTGTLSGTGGTLVLNKYAGGENDAAQLMLSGGGDWSGTIKFKGGKSNHTGQGDWPNPILMVQGDLAVGTLDLENADGADTEAYGRVQLYCTSDEGSVKNGTTLTLKKGLNLVAGNLLRIDASGQAPTTDTGKAHQVVLGDDSSLASGATLSVYDGIQMNIAASKTFTLEGTLQLNGNSKIILGENSVFKFADKSSITSLAGSIDAGAEVSKATVLISAAIAESIGAVTFNEGVDVCFDHVSTSAAESDFNLQDAWTLKNNLEVKSGTYLKFTNNGSLTLEGEISGDGTLVFWMSGTTIALKKGGAINELQFEWGDGANVLELGGDLEVKKITQSNGKKKGSQTVSKASGGAAVVHLVLQKSDVSSLTSLSAIEGEYKDSNGKLTIGDAVGYGISTSGTMTLSKAKEGSSNTLGRDFKFKGLKGTGKMVLSGDTYTFSKHLTLEDAKVDLTGGTLTITGGLVLTGDSNVLSVTSAVESGSYITVGSTELGGEGSLTIKISDSVLSGKDGTTGIENFFTGWQTSWSDRITLTAEDGHTSDYTNLSIDADGKLTWSTGGDAPLGTETWSDSATSLTWATSGGEDKWGDGHNAQYTGEGNVVFAGTGATSITVTVGGDGVSVTGDMTVKKGEGDTGGTYLFDADNSITVEGKLVIEQNTDVEFDVASGKKLSANGGTEVKGKLTIGGDDTSGSGNKSLGDVDIQNGGEVVIKQAWNLFNNSNTNCFHGENGTLTVDLSTYSQSQDFLNQFTNIIDGTGESKQLGTFEFRNAYLALQGNGVFAQFKNLNKVIVGENSSLLLEWNGTTGGNGWGKGNIELHLRGSGVKTGTSLEKGMMADAALSFYTHDTYNRADHTTMDTISLPWNITLDGDATVRTGRDELGENNKAHVLQLKGKLTNDGNHKLTKKGIGVLELANGFTATGVGTIDVQKGSLKLSYGTNETLKDYTVKLADGTTLESGITGSLKALTGKGTVKVTGGKLTLTTATGAELTNLAIDAGELVVSAGSFTISGGWTWGENAKLTLSTNGQQITLSGISQLNGGSKDHKLTIHLDTNFFGSVDGTTGIQLFAANGFTSGWQDYFTIETSDAETYKNIQLGDDGKLTWGEVVNDYVWSGTGNSLTLSDSISGVGWNVGSGTVDYNKSVTLQGSMEGEGPIAVTVSDGVVMSKLTIGKEAEGSKADTAEYTFSGSGDGAKLTANGEGIAVRADSTFESSVGVSGKNLVVSEGRTVTFIGGASKSFGEGIQLGTGATLVLKSEGEEYNQDSKSTESGWGKVYSKKVAINGENATLELQLGEAQAHSEDWFGKLFVETEKYQSVLGTLKLTDTQLTMDTDLYSRLTNVANIVITEGSRLTYAGEASGGGQNTLLNGSGQHTLHIAGSGKNGEGALQVTTGEAKIAWDIELTDHATISTSAASDTTGVSLSGEITGNGKTLTKKGNSQLIILSSATTAEGDAGGVFDVQAGLLWIQGQATNFAKWGVKLQEKSSLAVGTAGVGNDKVQLSFIDGNGGEIRNFTGAGEVHGVLVINQTDEKNSKTSGAFFKDWLEGSYYINLEKDGKGTQAFNAEDSGNLNSVTVKGGTLEFKNVNIVGDLKVNGGAVFSVSTGGTVTAGGLSGGTSASGSITGAGTLVLTADRGEFGGSIATNFTYNATTADSGNFKLTGAFTGGELKVQQGTLEATTSGTIAKATLAGGTLKVSGEDGLTVTSLDTQGGKLELSKELTVSGWTNTSGLTGLTLNTGGHLKLGESITTGTITLGQITLAGNADLTLDGTLNDLKLVGTWGSVGEDGSNKLTLHFTEAFLESIAEGAGTYELVASDGATGWDDTHVTFAQVEGYTVGWDTTAGTIKVTAVVEPTGDTQKWLGSEDEFTWNAASNQWTVGNASGQDFSTDRNVVFAGTNAGPITVKVSGAIDIGEHSMQVSKGSAGESQTYNFVLEGGTDGLKLGSLTVDQDVTANFKVKYGNTTNGVQVTDTTVNGTLILDGDDTATSGYSGKRCFGNVTVNEGGRVEVKQGWNLEGNKVSGDGTLVLNLKTYSNQALANMIDTTEGKKIANVEVAEGSLLDIVQSSDYDTKYTAALQHITNLNVVDGAALIIDTDHADIGQVTTLTLHLNGDGIDGDDNHAAALLIDTIGTYNAAGGSAKTVALSWGIVLDGETTIQTGLKSVGENNYKHVLQLKGNLNTGANKLTKQGIGVLELAEGFTATGTATIDVQQGTLKLSYGTSDALKNYTVNLGSGTTLDSGITGTVGTLSGSGTLTLSGGELTIGSADGATLGSLAMGGNKLTVSAGNFTIDTEWTWSEGAMLRLATSGQQITLGENLSQLNGGSSGTQLTIDLSKAFLGESLAADKGSVRLFASSIDEGWVDYFKFTVGGNNFGVGNYENLALDENGYLTWGPTDVPKEFAEWNKDATTTNNWSEGNWGDSNSTWGAAGSTKAYFSDEEGETITIDTTITADTVQVAQGNWTWKKGESGTLEVTNGITIDDKAELQLDMGDGKNSWLTFGEGKGISGAGSLAIALTEATSGNPKTYKASDTIIKLLSSLHLSADDSGEKLDLYFRAENDQSSYSGYYLQIDSDSNSDSHLTSELTNIQDLYIGEHVSLGITSNTGTLFTPGGNHTLHLSGNGSKGGSQAYGALHFEEDSPTMDWTVQLESAASISAASGTGTLTTVNGNGKDLTIGVVRKTGTIAINGITGEGFNNLNAQYADLELNFEFDGTVAETLTIGGTTSSQTSKVTLKSSAEEGSHTYKFGTLKATDASNELTTDGENVHIELVGVEGDSSFSEAADYNGKISNGVAVDVSGGYWWWSHTDDQSSSAINVQASGHVKLSGDDENSTLMTLSGAVSSAGGLVLDNVKASKSLSVTGGSLEVQNKLDVSAISADATVANADVTFVNGATLTGGIVISGGEGKKITLNSMTIDGNGGVESTSYHSFLDFSGFAGTLELGSGSTDVTLSIDATGRAVTEDSGTPGWALKLTKDQMDELNKLDRFKITITGWEDTATGIEFLDLTSGWTYESDKAVLTSFLEHITVGEDAASGKYTIDENGHLVLVPEESDDLYWGAAGSDTNITLGTGGDGEWSGTSGSTGTLAWGTEKNVHLEATSEQPITVTVGADATMKSLTVGAGATYNLTVADGTPQTATVTETLANDATLLSIGSNVTLSVGSYTGAGTLGLDGGTVELGSAGATVTKLTVSANGGTLKLASDVGNSDANKTPAATFNGVDGANGTLTVDGTGNVTLKFTNGGTLKSLTQAETRNLNVGIDLTGTMTLAEDGSIKGTLTLADSAKVTTGGDLSVGLLKGGAWNGALENGAEIDSSVDGPVTLKLTGSGNSDFWGKLVLGSTHKVNLEVNLTGSGGQQLFGKHAVDINGNLTIGKNSILLLSSNTEDKSEGAKVHGKLGGEGTLTLTMTTATIDGEEGDAGSIGKLTFQYYHPDAENDTKDGGSTLKLGGDLVVGSIAYTNDNSFNSLQENVHHDQNKIESSSNKQVYLIFDKKGTQEQTLADFLGGTGGYGAVKLGSNVGRGVKLESSAVLTLTGGGDISEAFKVTGGGTLKLSDGEAADPESQGYTFSGGLTLDGGTLELAGTKTVTVGGNLSWIDGAKLKLSSTVTGLNIALTGATLSEDASKLALEFTTDFLNAVGSGYQLFNWSGDLADRFDWSIDGEDTEGTYKNFKLRSDGTLFWGDITDLYWSGSTDNTELAWGTAGDSEWSTSAGTKGYAAWVESAKVHLGATTAVTVTLKDAEITADTVGFTAANATGGYTFGSDVDGGTKLTVAGITNSDSSAVGVKATFGEGVDVHVTGNFTNHNAKSEYIFKEKLIVDGQLSLWGSGSNYDGASVMTLEKGADVGKLEASWRGKFVLGEDLVVHDWGFEGQLNGGHWAWFERLASVEKEVYVDVQKGMNLSINGNGTMVFNEGIGIKSSTSGQTLTFVEYVPSGVETAPAFVVGGSFAAVNGGNMTFNVNAEAKMNVEVGEDSTITIGAGKTLTTSGLTGWQGDGGMTYGTIGGDGTLVLNDATGGGDFKGAVSSNFTYTGSESTTAFTLSGEFSGKSLTVSKGKLTLTGTTSLGGTGKTVEVAAGAELAVGATGQEVSVDMRGLTLNGTLTLNGGAKNTVSGDVTLVTGAKLDFKTGTGNAVCGAVTLNGGTLVWTGELSVGSLAGTAGLDNAANGGSLTLTGASSSYGQEIDLGTGTLATTGTGTHNLTGALTAGSVNVGSGTTLKLGAATLSGDSNTVAGSLELTGGSMKGLTGAGSVTTTGTLTLGTTEGYKGDLTIGETGSVSAADSLHVGSLNGKGGISLGEDKTITFEDASAETQAVYEGSITGTGVSLEMKAGNQKLTQAFTGAGVTVSGGALELAGGTITTLAGGESSGGNLAIIGALEVGTVSDKLGMLTLSSGQLTLKGGTLDVTGLTSGGGSLAISLTGGVKFADSMASLNLQGTIDVHLGYDDVKDYITDGYQLFVSNGVNTDSIKDNLNFIVDGEDANYKVTLENGRLTFTELHALLVWNGSDDLTWESAGAETADGWSHDGTFNSAQSVTFHGTAPSDVTVSLDGAIEVYNMEVGEAGNVTSYVFKATQGATDATLTVDGTLTLNDATTFEVTTEVKGALKGAADLTVKGNLTLNTTLTTDAENGFTGGITLDGGTLDLKGATNTLSEGKKLTLGAGGGTLNGSITAELDGQDAGTLTLGTGTQTFSGTTKGEVSVGGTLTGNSLTVGGLSGSGTLGGSITVDGAGGTFEGTDVGSLNLTVKSGTQGFSNSVTLSNVTLDGGTLQLLAGGAITSLDGAGGALDVTGTVSIGASTHSGLTSLTLADQAALDLTKLASLTLGAVTVAEGTATIAVGRGTDSITKLTVSKLSGNLTIDLSGVSKDSLKGGLQLFSGAISFVDLVGFTGVELGAREELTLNADDGTIKLTGITEPITWNGTDSDQLTWKEKDDTNQWTIGDKGEATNFMNGDTVLFTDTGDGANTVTLNATGATEEGKLKAASVTVKDGRWTFEGDELVVIGTLDVDGAAAFKNATSAKTLSGSGSVTLSDGGSLAIQDTLTADETSGFTGGVVMNGGTLKLGKSSTVASLNVTEDSELRLAQGSTLTLHSFTGTEEKKLVLNVEGSAEGTSTTVVFADDSTNYKGIIGVDGTKPFIFQTAGDLTVQMVHVGEQSADSVYGPGSSEKVGKLEIRSTKADGVATFTIDASEASDEGGVFRKIDNQDDLGANIYGALIIGQEDRKMNFVVALGEHRELGIGSGGESTVIWGDMTIQSGRVLFNRNAGDGAFIHGKLNGAGELAIMETTMTIDGVDGDVGSIGSLNFKWYRGGQSAFKLGGDLVVGAINYSEEPSATGVDHSKDRIESATGSQVYVILDKDGDSTLSGFVQAYGAATLGDHVGRGVKVSGTKTFTDGTAVKEAFKVTGGGTLTLSGANAYEFQKGLKLDGGTLELTSTGGLKVGESLTWTDGTTLRVSASDGLTIDLSGLTTLNDGKSTDHQLTLELTTEFLEAASSGENSYKLFDWGNNDFSQYFDVHITGEGTETYSGIKLGSDGTLTWDNGEEPLHSGLYWDASKDDDGTLTWEGKDKEWSTSEDGAPNAAWPSEEGASDGLDIHIAGTEEADYAVEMDGDVTAKDVEFNGGDYTFAEGEGKLTIEGNLTVGTDKKTTVDFGNKQLDVGGNLTAGDGSTLATTGDATVQGDLTLGDGGEATVGGALDVGGKLTTGEGGKLATTGDATVQGDLSLGNGGEATVGGVLDVGGNLSTGDDSKLTAEGSAVVQGDFSVGKNGETSVGGMLNVGGDLGTGEGGKLTTEGDTSVAGGLTLGKDSNVTANSTLDVTGDVNVGGGSLTANGGGTWGSAQVAPGGSLSMTGTTVTGDVKMGNGSSVTMDGSTVNGELSVEGGKLTVGGKSTLGSVSGTLTGLEIADGSLTVNGNGLAADTFTWGSDSTLGLGSGFTGTLDFGSMDGDGKLTLNLSSQFLDQLGADENSVKLFENWNESWGDKLELTINGRTPDKFRDGYYGDLQIGDDGTLTWTTKGKSYYESSTDNETADDGTKTEWNTNGENNIYDSVGDYGQVIVDSNTNIDFSEASKGEEWEKDGLTVHNLQGGNSNATLTITGDGGAEVKDNNKVTLKNTSGSESGDLTYSGGVTVEKAELHINHEDNSPDSKHHGAEWGTVMGGELNLSQGQGLYMDRGVLKLQNEANQLTDVKFTNGCDGQLVVDGGSATVSGDILLDAGEAVYETERNHVHLENGGTLELVGGTGKEDPTTVGAGVTIGGNDASGSAVGMKGKVNMEKGSRISGLHLILEDKDTVLTVGKEKQPPAGQEPAAYALAAEEPEGGTGAEKNTTFSIYGIQSNGGHLTGNENMVINVRDWDHVFTGSMAGYKGTMTFTSRIERIEDLFRAQTPQQYFTQVTAGSSDWNMVVDSGARVTLNVLNSKGRNAGWVMGDVELRLDSQTTLGFTFSSGGVRSASATGMSFSSFRLAEGAGLTLQAYGSAMPTSKEFVLGQMTEGGAVDLHWEDGSEVAAAANEVESNDNEELELKRNQLVGGAWLHVESAKIVHVHDDTKNQIVLEMEMTTENSLAEAVQGIHQNATEGANALWQLTDTVNNPKANEALNDPNSDTSKLSAEAQRLMSNGNKAELAKLLAASAGAGYTGYSAALGEDMHRQLTAIRNRTTSMGDEAAAGRDEDMPYWHAWLNAESSYRELDADDLAPGYRINGWGGTFGVDADISRDTTLGLALTAMYNDLKCTGADSISGDMDTMYASAFLRHMRGRWMHTIVLSGGTADFKTHRTVMSGSGNYTADADTSGYSLGALYEIGYTTVLSKDSRRVMQYVFNVEARHNSIDGFTESGSDAGLVVDDMDSMTVTFGLGARLQSLFGGKVYNRSALFEARFLVKADAGDRRGEAATRFINGSYATNMVGAEVGALGVELGAGITVPVGSTPYSGSFFIDGSLEFRQGWTSFDATLGYRISF